VSTWPLGQRISIVPPGLLVLEFRSYLLYAEGVLVASLRLPLSWRYNLSCTPLSPDAFALDPVWSYA
jgi:hypothetical protein